MHEKIPRKMIIDLTSTEQTRPLGSGFCSIRRSDLINRAYVYMYVCVCVFSSHPFWTSMDVPAGVTQEEGHTGFLIHLPSAVLYVRIFIKLHITAQYGPVILVILCHSHMYVCMSI